MANYLNIMRKPISEKALIGQNIAVNDESMFGIASKND